VTGEPQDVISAGLDGSAASLAAARWAAGVAQRRGIGLRLVHAWEPPPTGGRPGEQDESPRAAAARHVMTQAREEIERLHLGIPVEESLIAGDPGATLLAVATESRALALGTHGMRRLPSFFLGGTSLSVVARAERPVVLVRDGGGGADTTVPAEEAAADAVAAAEDGTAGPRGAHEWVRPPGAVVVGLPLDHSAAGLLEFAFTAADGSRLPLRVIHGAKLPRHAYMPGGPVIPHLADEFRRNVEKEMRAVVTPWAERFPDVRMKGCLRLSSPAHALISEAEGAALLVVGRSRRRRVGARVGSVAQAAVHHAACPVAVVPHD
jgi:nucleotide-binding universal stress UspA family protein